MFLSLIGLASCARYALLYAGDRDFYNYRFQADIFTIYYQLLNRGFTKENVLLYAYDDIATDPENPFKGKVFHNLHHKVNVYPGTDSIDIKGKDVTAQALYDGITSLPTTSEDFVFIYYGGNGGYGVFGTPYGDYIYADNLSNAINTASTSNLFKKCLCMFEASFSGSVAEIISSSNVAIITSANDQESSYASNYDSYIGVYLSTEFTSHVIDLMDKQPTITVGEFYTQAKSLTLESHVSYYGDEGIQSLPISTFFGNPNSTLSQVVQGYSKPVTQKEASDATLLFLSQHPKISIRSKAKLQIIRRKSQTEKLNAVLEMIVEYVDPNNYERIMKDTESKITPTYFQVLRTFAKKFGEINPNDYGSFKILKALSASHSKAEIVQAIFAIL